MDLETKNKAPPPPQHRATHDLHYHYDGSISPQAVWSAFADLPVSAARARAMVEETLLREPVKTPQQFFDLFQKVMALFELSGGVYPLLDAQFGIATTEGLRHLDLRFGCGALAARLGLTERAVLNEFKRAVCDAKRGGLDICPTLCFSRYETMERAAHLSEFVLANRDFIRAIDLEGQEAPNRTADYASIFTKLKDAGLRVTVHAGEFSSSESIWAAIDACGAERIGHGFSAVDDPVLVKRLAKDQIPVEVSLTSNYLMGLCADLKSHPFLELLEAGVPVVLCTDDRGLFQTSLTNEYLKAATIFRNTGHGNIAVLDTIADNSRRFAFTEAGA